MFREDIVVNTENKLCEQSLNSVSFLLIPLRNKSSVLLPSSDVLVIRSYDWCVKLLEIDCVSTWARPSSGNGSKNLLNLFTEFEKGMNPHIPALSNFAMFVIQAHHNGQVKMKTSAFLVQGCRKWLYPFLQDKFATILRITYQPMRDDNTWVMINNCCVDHKDDRCDSRWQLGEWASHAP